VNAVIEGKKTELRLGFDKTVHQVVAMVIDKRRTNPDTTSCIRSRCLNTEDNQGMRYEQAYKGAFHKLEGNGLSDSLPYE
jgi:hypothetical protein